MYFNWEYLISADIIGAIAAVALIENRLCSKGSFQTGPTSWAREVISQEDILSGAVIPNYRMNETIIKAENKVWKCKTKFSCFKRMSVFTAKE